MKDTSDLGVFAGRKRNRVPANMILDIHSYCNAKCEICPYPELSRKLSMGTMDEWLFHKIIDDFALIVKEHKVRGHILFCNMGEPLVDSNVISKIDYASKAGLQCVLQTNAFLLTREKTDQLLATGFNGPIYISCHGITPAVYKNVMGLDIEQTLKNIDYLIERYPRENIQIRAVPYQWPLGEVLRVKRFWRNRGVRVKIFLPNSRAGLVSQCLSSRLKYPGEKLRGCKKNLPLSDIVVAFNGDVILCCEDMGRRVVLGNLKEKSIEQVWNSSLANNILDQIYNGRHSGSEFICKQCEFGVSTPLQRIARFVDNELGRLFKCHF
jgi:radical SAM protein with 4Fe4S-binding SPASM domain